MLVFILSDFGISALDVTDSFSLSSSNDVTEYSVESGFDISKGVLSKSDTFTISGLISDYHIKDSRDFRSDEIISQLKSIKESRSVVTVVLKSLSYSNLIITDISSSESVTSGHAKSVSLTFKQVRFVSSRNTAIPRSAIKSSSASKDGTASGDTKNNDTADKTSSTSSDGTKTKESSGGIAEYLAGKKESTDFGNFIYSQFKTSNGE